MTKASLRFESIVKSQRGELRQRDNIDFAE